MNARHAREIRAGALAARQLVPEPRTVAVRWLCDNPKGLPERSIRAARRVYARTIRRRAAVDSAPAPTDYATTEPHYDTKENAR